MRCGSAKFRFRPLPVSSMIERITYIAKQENVNLGAEALDTILNASGGDMRKAVTFLQTSHQLASASGGSSTEPVTSAMVVDIAGVVPSNVMQILWTAMSGRKFDVMKNEVNQIISQGYPMGQLLSQLHDDVVEGTFSGTDGIKLSDASKGMICEKIACADLALADGSSEALQLLDVASYVMRRLNESISPVDTLVAAH